MLTLLSPAKTLDLETPCRVSTFTEPALLPDTAQLIPTLRQLSQKKIRELMDVSPALAKLNAGRYAALTPELHADNARPAILTFKGAAFTALDAPSLLAKDLRFAQDHLRILSGLYGVLRPLDLMQAHRLEMGTRLKTRRGQSLYDFWGERIRVVLQADLARQADRTVINLASTEYFRATQPKRLDARVVTPVFLDTKNGKSRTVFLFAKQARGAMARFMIRQRVGHADGLKDFSEGGYAYRAKLSDPDRWVFERPQPPPAKR